MEQLLVRERAAGVLEVVCTADLVHARDRVERQAGDEDGVRQIGNSIIASVAINPSQISTPERGS